MSKGIMIDDIKARLMANLPVGIGNCGQREQLEKEWKILEERINKYYMKKEVGVKK
jgi:hypothetical protein